MIFIFTALFPEAKPLIKKLELKKRTDSTRFQQFVSGPCSKQGNVTGVHSSEIPTGENVFSDNMKPGIVLTITGVGPISAATAVSATLTEYDVKGTDQILSFGTAAMLHGTVLSGDQAPASPLFLINKILDQNVDRTFYPDMLIKSHISEASVVTGNTVLSERAAFFMDMAAEDYDLYDMEAASVYQAASFFAGPHQMSFLRVVTDHGIQGESYDVRQMSQIVNERVTQCVDEIVDYVEKLIAVSERDEKHGRSISEEDDYLVEKIIEDGHFSKVMQDQLKQYVKYAALSGINWRSTVEALYRDAVLPTIDKRGGKKVLDAIRNSITE